MQDIDVEKELKDSADKITNKSFRERWDAIKDRISSDNGHSEVLSENTALVGSDGTVTHNESNKKRVLLVTLLSFFICCVLVLSIVLPIILKKDDMTFLIKNELVSTTVNEKQFFDEMDNLGYDLIDFSKYEVNYYMTLSSKNNEVKGGIVELSNDDVGYLLNVAFYDSSVILDEDYSDYEECVANSTRIKFLTTVDGEVYNTIAFANYKKLNYQLELLTLEDNCKHIFEELFS